MKLDCQAVWLERMEKWVLEKELFPLNIAKGGA
jgi:hypothetical protein